MIKQHIWRLENQESCSGATKMGNGTSPMGWESSRPETKLTSDWPVGMMLEIQERSKDQCRIAEDSIASWTFPCVVWERFNFIANNCGIYPDAIQKHYRVTQFPREWQQKLRQWFTNGVFVLPSVGTRRINFCFLQPMEQEYSRFQPWGEGCFERGVLLGL